MIVDSESRRRWLTCKNLEGIRFEQEVPGTPEEILTGFKRGRGTFSRMFEIMAMCVSIVCEPRIESRVE